METSSVNAPHPDGDTDDADDFFGRDEPTQAEKEAAEGAAYREGHGEPEPAPGTMQTAEQTAEARAAREDAEWDGAAPPHSEEAELPPAEPEPAPAATGGSLAREYVVFQQVPLTEKTLRLLLQQIEEGIKPRVAFIELGRAETRNDKQAIAEVYMTHQEELGEKCDLAAVSSRAFKQRSIAPEEVPAEKRIKIS